MCAACMCALLCMHVLEAMRKLLNEVLCTDLYNQQDFNVLLVLYIFLLTILLLY